MIKSDSNFELEHLTETPQRIPKKPFFRIAKYESLKQVQLVRVKLWKISFCNLRYLSSELELAPESQSEDTNTKELQFSKMQRAPTLKKSLKNVRKVSGYGDKVDYRYFASLWRLEELKIGFVSSKFQLKRFFKLFRYNKLQNLTLEHWQSFYYKYYDNKSLVKALSYFCNLKECTLNFPYNNKGEEVPSILHRFQKLQKLTLDGSSDSFLVPNSLKYLRRLEELTLPMTMWDEHQNILSNLKHIPNLKSLNVHFRGTYNQQNRNNLSFLENCPKLESLTLFLERIQNYSLDFLVQMEHLKELVFKETGGRRDKNQPLKKFPKLEKLQKFGLFLRNTQFCLDSIQEMLIASKELKELSLDISLPEIVDIFKGNLTLPFDALSLEIPKTNVPYGDSLKNLNIILRRHNNLKKFTLSTLNTGNILVPDTFRALGALTLLEELVFKFPQCSASLQKSEESGSEEKSIFDKLSNLKTLIFDVKKIQVSPSFGRKVKVLLMLPKLKKVVIEANFDKVDAITFDNIINNVRATKQKKNVEFTIFGYSHDSNKEAKRFVNSESSLWRLSYVYE